MLKLILDPYTKSSHCGGTNVMYTRCLYQRYGERGSKKPHLTECMDISHLGPERFVDYEAFELDTIAKGCPSCVGITSSRLQIPRPYLPLPSATRPSVAFVSS